MMIDFRETPKPYKVDNKETRLLLRLKNSMHDGTKDFKIIYVSNKPFTDVCLVSHFL